MPPRRTRKAAAKATAETKITVPVAVVEEKVEKAVENLDLAESNDMETDQVPEGATEEVETTEAIEEEVKAADEEVEAEVEAEAEAETEEEDTEEAEDETAEAEADADAEADTKEAAKKDKKPKQEREEEHVLFPFPEKSAETTMNGIRRMYYAANSFAIQNKLNKPSGGPIVNGALRCQQKGKHLNSTEKYARHVMDVCIQTYQNNEKFMKNAKGKKATHDNRKWKVTSYFCSSVALSARSEFLMNKIVEGRLLNQLHGTSKNGHYVVLKMPRIFNSVVPKLLAWMHGGKLILKKAQIKLFIRALSFFQIMLPHKCVQELCDIIGHRWVFPKRKNFKKEKKEQQAKEAKEGEAKELEAEAAEAPAETETEAKEEETSQNKENDAEAETNDVEASTEGDETKEAETKAEAEEGDKPNEDETKDGEAAEEEVDERPVLSRDLLLEDFSKIKDQDPYEEVKVALPRAESHAMNVYMISRKIKETVNEIIKKDKEIQDEKDKRQNKKSNTNNSSTTNSTYKPLYQAPAQNGAAHSNIYRNSPHPPPQYAPMQAMPAATMQYAAQPAQPAYYGAPQTHAQPVYQYAQPVYQNPQMQMQPQAAMGMARPATTNTGYVPRQNANAGKRPGGRFNSSPTKKRRN